MRRGTCTVDECGRPAHGRGFCLMHWKRWKRHGDPKGTAGHISRDTGVDWLRAHSDYSADECLFWPFARCGNGYPRVGTSEYAHRIMCEIVNGPPPSPTHEAAHSCGRGHDACISPVHLSWKTCAENHADKLVHGTDNRGERCGTSKLTEVQVREIKLSDRDNRSLADKYSVGIGAIQRIRRGAAWWYVNV